MIGSTIIKLEKEKFVKQFKIVIYKNSSFMVGEKRIPGVCCNFIKTN